MWSPPPSYSRHHSVPGNQGVTIVLACPRCCPAPCPAPALHSALSLYLGCAGGAGAGAALLWVTGHLYVLAHTQEDSLRQQRSEHAVLVSSVPSIQLCQVCGRGGWSGSAGVPELPGVGGQGRGQDTPGEDSYEDSD